MDDCGMVEWMSLSIVRSTPTKHGVKSAQAVENLWKKDETFQSCSLIINKQRWNVKDSFLNKNEKRWNDKKPFLVQKKKRWNVKKPFLVKKKKRWNVKKTFLVKNKKRWNVKKTFRNVMKRFLIVSTVCVDFVGLRGFKYTDDADWADFHGKNGFLVRRGNGSV